MSVDRCVIFVLLVIYKGIHTHSVWLRCAIHTKDMNRSRTVWTVSQNRIKNRSRIHIRSRRVNKPLKFWSNVSLLIRLSNDTDSLFDGFCRSHYMENVKIIFTEIVSSK